MVDMSVGEDHGVDRVGVERQVAVAVFAFAARPLVEAAIEQDARAVNVEQVLRTGHRSRRAVKRDLHVILLLFVARRFSAIGGECTA